MRRKLSWLLSLGLLLALISASESRPALANPVPTDKICKTVRVRLSTDGQKVTGRATLSSGVTTTKRVCYNVPDKHRVNATRPQSQTEEASTRCRALTVASTEAEKVFCALLTRAALGTAGTAAPADPEALARQLAVYLRLPDTPPHFGPNPDNNEWKMLAVGYPVWLWVDGPLTKSTTVSASGLTFQLTARRTGTTFTMGDGTTLHCAATTRYRRDVTPGTPSPTCGHVYKKPSLPGGAYTVTATAHWTITWNVAGLSGTFPLNYSDSAQLRIGELQALVR